MTDMTPDVVRLPLPDLFAPVLDELALAVAAEPELLGRLLAAHATRVLDADLAQMTGAPEWALSLVAEQAAASRGALVAESMTARDGLSLYLTPDEATDLAQRLLTTAAQVRRHNARKGRD